MDPLMTAAARALAAGDPLTALKRVALRDDPPALALRGIAMAQLGDLARGRDLLRRAARAFGGAEPRARARCIIAEAEIALVSRDLGRALDKLGEARAALEALGDRRNAAHAGYLEARRLLLVGRLDEAEGTLRDLHPDALSPASHAGCGLVAAGIAMRRIRVGAAGDALDQAGCAARKAGIPALIAEVDRARHALKAPAARLIWRDGERLLRLEEVEDVLASDVLVVDACRNVLRASETAVSFASRPVLFVLLRTLAEAWPDDVSRETLLLRAFRARHADDSHRARLRVEIGRLRKAVGPLAALSATKRGFRLNPQAASSIVVLAPPDESAHADVLALLADGEAWAASALALALGVSARTVQRALEALARDGRAESFGRGRACRWIAPNVPGFPTSLLLPAPVPGG